jgi:putative addiction module killer protein
LPGLGYWYIISSLVGDRRFEPAHIKINLIIDDLYLVGYIIIMAYTIETTKQYDKWFKKLKDALMKIKVLARLSRVENGNFGDSKQLSDSLFELRFFFGSGIRIYYTIKEGKIVLLLVGGDKSSQQKDIDKAEVLLKKMED